MKNKKDSSQFLRFWLPVYLYAGLIFILSSFPQPIKALPFFHGDKLLHLIEYAILGYLLARAARHSSHPKLCTHFRIFAVYVAFLYGITDEFHQYFVPGRVVDILDLVANAAGAFCGQLFIK